MLPTYRPNFAQVAVPSDRCSRPGNYAVTLFVGWTWFQSCLEYLTTVTEGFHVLILAGDSKHIAIILACVEMGQKKYFLLYPHYINNGILLNVIPIHPD